MSAGNDPFTSGAGKTAVGSSSGQPVSGSFGTSVGTAELPRATSLAELRGTIWQQHAGRSVKDEIRQNLVVALRSGTPLFKGVRGYQDTVVPAVVNALLSRHTFILLGLRGQATPLILR